MEPMRARSDRFRLRLIASIAGVASAVGLSALWSPDLAAQSADTVRYAAGFEILTVPSGKDRIAVALSYPASAKEADVQMGPYTLRIAREAPVARGRHGIILLSHGAGGGSLNHRTTAFALSRAGWIVAAIEHPGGNWRDKSRIGTHADFEGRPRHLRAVLDALLAHPEWSKSADPKRVGAVGYSMGGYTVLAAIGGRPDVHRLARHCSENIQKDPRFCGYRKKAGTLPPLKIVPDRRIGAALVVAPVAAIFGPGAFKGVTAKIRVYRAEKDEELAFPYHAANLQTLLPTGSEYRTVKGMGHFTFIAPFPAGLRGVVGRVAKDPPGIDRAQVHKVLNAEIVKYFATALPKK